jgi:hypothetical protein
LPWIKETTVHELSSILGKVWLRLDPMRIQDIRVIQGKILITFDSPALPDLREGEHRHIDELGVIMSTTGAGG